MILALELYFREPSARGRKTHPAVMELSAVLNRLAIHSSYQLDADFRNPNGVGMKLSNFLRFDPEYEGEGLKRGSRLEEEVWNAFAHDRDRLRTVAQAIRSHMIDEQLDLHEEDEDDEEAEEGRILSKIHKSRERSRKLVAKKKRQILKETGRLECEACGFDFHERYGALGDGFAECHHTKPVSELNPGEKTKVQDLAILCANCHRMVHRQRPWLTVEKLKDLVTYIST